MAKKKKKSSAKPTKPADLAERPLAELTQLVVETEQEIFRLQTERQLGKLKSLTVLRQTKRQLARVKTVIREKELAGTSVKKPAQEPALNQK